MTAGYTYLTPHDSAAVIKARFDTCLNLGLILGRYVPQEAIENQKEGKDTARSVWLRQLMGRFKVTDSKNNPLSQLVASNHQRWMAMTENSSRFTMVTRSRLIVGLGGKGALEFGITLHPVTGLPYIPGSALKGLCRNYKLLVIAGGKLPVDSKVLAILDALLSGGRPDQRDIDQLDPTVFTQMTELAAQHGQMYREIFGTQGKAGGCTFFDAVLNPLEKEQALFELDVMTPHFSDYYSNKGDASHAPHDADKPIPVTFITVPAGAKFSCAVGLRRNANDAYLKDATDTLKKALEEMGIGAKTAAGYGVFGSFERIKIGIEVDDEIAGEVFDTSNGIWFTPDEEFIGEREYEAQIPSQAVQKRRNEGERVKARVVEVREGKPIYLICEQIVEGKKK